MGLGTTHRAVLGLLSLGATHGYDLFRILDGGDGVSRLVALKPATVYAVLHDLEAQGLVQGEQLTEGYPPRTRFAVTNAGKVSLDAWLTEPVHRIREVRSDFLLKMYFARRLLEDGGLRLLEQQLDIIAEYSRRLEEELSVFPPESFDYLVLESKVTAAQITENWLKRHRERLVAARPG